MTRSFGAVDLVRLPVLSVTDAIAIGTALITWADEVGQLPAQVRKPLARLRKKLDELSEVARSRVAESAVDSALAREVDRLLDAAWSAAYSWCTGWSKLPFAPELSHSGEELRTALFADGLKFTQLKYSAQWVESQARLDYIKENALDRLFDELGGRAILTTIQQAHARYGEVLGLTKTKLDESVSARERLDAFCNELRHYIVKVAATVNPDDEATQELAEHLLLPLANWKSRSPAEPAETPAEPEADSDLESKVTAADLNAGAAADQTAADSSSLA